MKTAISSLYIITILLGVQLKISGQPVVDFTLPDSSCIGAQITITNLTTGGSTFYWNFCSGNTTNDPTGVNIGNAGGLLSVPTYMTLVQDGNNCYSFISCQQAGIIRYYHGTTFNHNPISWTNFGTFSGILGTSIEGIQVKKDNGNWYGFVCNNTTLVRLDFGVSLANTPTAIDLGPFSGLIMLHGLVVMKEGTTWMAFANCSTGDKFVRFNFGNSLTNIPTITDFGDLGVLINPGPLCIVKENLLWYALMINGNASISRLTFGNSLLNVPTGENLGNPGGVLSGGGLSIVRDCDLTSGYFTKYLTNGQLGKLIFTGGVTGTVTGQVLGNIGNLNLPHSFSEIFRQNDTLFAYITNRGSNTLTRLTFPPCANASVPSSTLFNPPPFSYNQPGTYNVRLLVNEGLPDQVSLCKTIIIGAVPIVNLGPDRSICPGTYTTLDAGAGYTTYLWSTGATIRTIIVSVAGTYSVTVTKTGCTANDEVNVSLYSVTPVNLGPDTTVCQGQTVIFDAGACAGCTYLWIDLGSGLTVGTSQTFTTGLVGIYKVTVTNTSGCQVMDTVQLLTITTPVVTNFPLAKSICSGNSTNIILTSNVPITTFSWTATGSSGFVAGYSSGIGNTINQVLTNSNTVNETVTYFITPVLGSCVGNTVAYIVTVIPISTVNISIVSSSNNICVGTMVTFTATPTNGGINPSYQWKVNGLNAGSDFPVYTYVPLNGDIVACVLTSSNITCISNNPALSNAIIMIVNPVNIVNISISPSANPVCSGSTVTFTATPQNEGTSPTYQWQVNGINVGTNNPIYTFTPAENDQVICILNSSETLCIANNPATSNQVNMTVNVNLPVSVTISPDANPVCAGSPITITATPVNGGTLPTYQWKVNGVNQGSNSPLFTYTPSNNDAVSCMISSDLSCTTGNPATSTTVIMTVNPNLPVSVSVAESANPVCAGTPVTFTAAPVNGGALPTCQWKVNGINIGPDSPAFTYAPSNNDAVSCVLTSDLTCTSGNPATSNIVVMTINPNLPVTISISADANPVCSGTSVSFTANPVNGGILPAYQWQVNSINVGTNIPNFTYIPANGDLVSCVLTSSESCTSSNPASSIQLQMIVNPNLPVSVSLAASDNPVCAGIAVTFTAIPANGGSSPSYQWKVNGINVGTNNPAYTYNPSNNDLISCLLTSNLTCTSGNPATSNAITMSVNSNPIVTFNPCFDTVTTINAKPFMLKGGIPLGGTYSGPGVNSLTGVFTPSLAGIGTHSITYTYTNAALCSTLAHANIINYPFSIVNCGSPITDIRDNKVYPTVQIGTQCWMAANLNYGSQIAGSSTQRDNCIVEKYCYNDIPVRCTTGSVFYQWDELMQYDFSVSNQGLCPPGWHVPTENDWNILFVNWTNNGFAGSPLKYSGYSGYNALLAGTRLFNISWSYDGFATFFWSSTAYTSTKSWAHVMNDYDPSVALYPASRANAFSVRCLKD